MYCLSVWGNLVCDSVIAKLQKLQKNVFPLLPAEKNSGKLKICRISDFIFLENVKFGYMYTGYYLLE